MEIWVLGGDARNFWAAERLRAGGCAVQTHGVPGAEDAALPARFGAVALPCPALAGDCLRGERALPLPPLLERMAGGTRVYGGLLGPWAEQMRARGARVTDLWDTEPLTTATAAATAEGAVALALGSSPRSLQGARCLVIGFGRIGKLLALKLRGLAARVTVAARKPGDRALAEGMGLEAEVAGQYHRGLSAYDLVFNTVPAPVLSPMQLRRLKPDCLLLELASAPGGFDRAQCAALGLTALAAPGLPGVWAPQTAGQCYGDAILQAIKEEEP